MKKTYIIVVISLLITTMTACKKDNNDNPKDYEGVWELAETSSMMPTQLYDPGNGNLLSINSDGSYVYSKNDSVTETGNYKVVTDNSVEENVCLKDLKDKYKERFAFSNISTPYAVYPANYKVFFYVADDKLYMIGGCFAVDGGSYRVYRRLKVYAM